MKDKVAISKVNEKPTIVVQQGKASSWWLNLTEEQRKVVTTISIALGISLLAALAIFIGNKIVRNKIANSEESKSLGGDKHATWAKQIKNAFDNNGWWGTDEELLRNTLREIPSKEDFQKVQKSYRNLTKGGNLIEDMTGELKQTEYNEMLAILNSKPNKAKDAKNGVVINDPYGWAKRIYAAVSYQWLGVFWGTDKPAITAVFLDIPTQKAFLETAKAYSQLYGTSLINALLGDLSQGEVMGYLDMVKKKPKM